MGPCPISKPFPTDRFRPSIPLIVLLSNLALILLPVAGITALRLYESALVRQTENALVSQAAFVTAMVREGIARNEGLNLPRPGDDERWRPRFATLDLSNDPVAPLPIPPLETELTVDRRLQRLEPSILPILYDAQDTTLSAIRVIDTRGTIAISTGEDTGRSLAHWPLFVSAQTGARDSALKRRERPEPAPPLSSISRTSRIRVFYAEPLIINGEVRAVTMVWRTPPNIAQTLWGKRRELALALLIMVAALSALTLGIVYAIRNPLRRLEKMAAQVIRGQTESMQPLRNPRTREVANLSVAINAMAEGLDRRATYVRDLAARISHEFKSPITSINGAAELLTEYGDTMPEAQRRQFIENISADGERMNRLVSRLMELAEADFRQVDSEQAVLLGSLLDGWRESYGERVTWALGEGLADRRVPQESITSIFVNLIDNALTHGTPGKLVRVMVSQIEGAALHIRVTNEGETISAEVLDRMFEPFYTTARDNGGTGLGLAVASAAVQALSGTITASSAQGVTTLDVEVSL